MTILYKLTEEELKEANRIAALKKRIPKTRVTFSGNAGENEELIVRIDFY